eukprot:1960428-Rhodomonas_salina.1
MRFLRRTGIASKVYFLERKPNIRGHDPMPGTATAIACYHPKPGTDSQSLDPAISHCEVNSMPETHRSETCVSYG